VVVHGEVDGQGRGSKTGQLSGTAQTMVSIGPHPTTEWQSDKDHQRRQGPAYQTESCVPFAHVVEQRSHDGLLILAPIGHHDQSRVIAVTLVGRLLCEEDAGELWGQPGLDGALLGLSQRLRRGDVEETSEEVRR
jgi:hypothetical protein